jgi:mycofactocin system glycosyltransferase
VTTVPVPAGFGIALDLDTRPLTANLLFGGSPARVMRLSDAGRAAYVELLSGPVVSRAAGLLARRLTDAGLAHPRPPPQPSQADVTVVIPVRDRAAMLERCLAALDGHTVVVIDDGSVDPRPVAEAAARHGAKLLRLDENAGPGAARNIGLAEVGTELVAFLDSDCVPPRGWIGELSAHLADPLVGAVAPRIVARAPDAAGSAARYAIARGSLDLGEREGRVAPATRVAYVPTAALLVRRDALTGIARGAEVFDPALRHGEDVDLVWRLHAAGWRIRYEPHVRVSHEGPDTWAGIVSRRFQYGTSAAPLALRHPDHLAPLVLQPWPTVAVAGLLTRRPAVVAVGVAGGALTLLRALRRADVPATGTTKATLTAVRQTWLGAGRYCTQLAGPALVAALIEPDGHGARRWGRRAAVASLLLGPALAAWRERRPGLDPVRFTLGHVADDIAYGAGVWAGCVRERTLVPVRPRISWRPLRVVAGAVAHEGRDRGHGRRVD